MSFEIPGTVVSREAAGDLTASYLKFVKLSGANIVAVAAATDALVLGVLQNKPNAAGIVGSVMVDGITRVKAAAAIAAGVAVFIDATGQVTTTAQAGKSVGVTMTATANAGEIISVLLKPLGAIA